MREHRIMGVWVLELGDAARAADVFHALPGELGAGAELCARCDGAQIRTPLAACAEWVKAEYGAEQVLAA